jgi:hypothetical protein
MKKANSLPSRGWWIFRKEFYSLHSFPHCETAVDGVCEHGTWNNVYVTALSHRFFKLSPRLWRIWANRRSFNSTREFLLKTFPNLK